MANFNEDSPNTPTPNPDGLSTSEVGFEPVMTVKGIRAIVRGTVEELNLKPSAEPTKTVLPDFNPEIPGADPVAWCTTAGLIMKDHTLQDRSEGFRSTLALQGVFDEGLTWPVFTEFFTTRFGSNDTATSTLMKILDEQPQKGENSAAFAIRVRSLIKIKWQHITLAELFNAVAFYRVSSLDRRIERVAFERDIRTEDQFLSEIRVFAHKKRRAPLTSNTSTGPVTKRHKLSDSQNKCLYCGAFGHKMTECRKRMRAEKRKIRRPEGGRQTTSSKALCFKCQAEGHIAPDCSLRKERGDSNDQERRVEFCVVEAPTGKLSLQGESFPFCFDSGAECSLIKESVASKLSGRRTADVVVMRGIGNTCVKSTSQILSTVCVNVFALEITFHVLPDSHLKYDIMIGREILSQGFDVHTTRDSLDICKTKIVNACNRTVENEIDLSEVDTEVLGNDKGRLISILERFRNSFITGFPRTRVTTGQLEI